MEAFKKNLAYAFVGLLALFCAGVWSVVYADAPFDFAQGKPLLTFAVLDVGQGDALYIEGPTGIQVVVDGGPDDALLAQLPLLMPALDRSLDAIIETHPDADHIGGFVALLSRYDVGAFISPGILKNTSTAKKLEQEVDELRIPRIIARRGMTLELGPGATLTVLYPDRDVSALPGEKANEGCIVAKLQYKNTTALLTCDAPASVEARLLQLDGTALKSDVLKVAHHGSKYSSTEPFIAAVRPSVAVISVGTHNSYGHPTKRVLDTLSAQSVETLRTDEDGRIVCTSDGLQFTCE